MSCLPDLEAQQLWKELSGGKLTIPWDTFYPKLFEMLDWDLRGAPEDQVGYRVLHHLLVVDGVGDATATEEVSLERFALALHWLSPFKSADSTGTLFIHFSVLTPFQPSF